MRSNKRKSYSRLSRSVFNRFFASTLVLFVVLAGGYLLARLICTQFVWYDDSPLYGVLKTLQAIAPVFILVVMLIGCAVFMIMAIKRPLSYLDDVIEAAKTLPEPDAPDVVLPEELADAEMELNLAKARFRENLRQRDEAEQRKNDLVMYLAHDLKTPLSSVMGYLTLLHDEGEISPQLREKYLSIALDKAQRLEDLINEFFEITRFNLSTITLQYGTIDLTRLLEQLIFEFQPMLKDKNLTCRLQAPQTLMIRCDAERMQRVFDNLLRNAVLYGYPESEIEVSVQLSENAVAVRFQNHGDTIPKEKLARIFEQFYRLDAARSSRGGAGLGLAIAKQIVELHGGRIEAESANDTATFTVTLPLSQESRKVGKS